ncbi:hypothetical protein [Streptomyces sp. CAU 1734]|uniref:hypothetical protein n=1 Tax=Streptomyces sp. CAU 1734 TaxID=3140360 RepID=UPI00326137E6
MSDLDPELSGLLDPAQGSDSRWPVVLSSGSITSTIDLEHDDASGLLPDPVAVDRPFNGEGLTSDVTS